VPWSFFEGQPVVYDQAGKGAPALGVVRAVFPAAAAAAEARYWDFQLKKVLKIH
jgi:hypothetical protein